MATQSRAVAGAKRKIKLGHISGTFGVKGWVKVHSDTHPRENIVTYPRWYLSSTGTSSKSAAGSGFEPEWFELESGRPQGKTIIVKLKGVESPEEAQCLIGRVISVDREALPALEDGEYYWADLIGFMVRNTNGVLLGRVDRLFETGANDVLVVRRQNEQMGDTGGDDKAAGGTDKSGASSEILIPWVRDSVIVDVQLENSLIRVDWDPDY